MKTQAERRLGLGLMALLMTLVWGAAMPATSRAAPMYSITDLGPADSFGDDLTITADGQVRALSVLNPATYPGNAYVGQAFTAGTFTVVNRGNAGDPSGSYPYLQDSATGKGVQIVYGNSADATAVSSNGSVVGFTVGSSGWLPFVYTQANGMVSLSWRKLHTQMNPNQFGYYPDYWGINSQGLVVGNYWYGTLLKTSAFINSLNPGSFAYGGLDLNNLLPPKSGWTLTSANGISEAGQIVGYGFDSSGRYSAYELTPEVPEPSVLAFFGTVCAGMAMRAAVRRRRERLSQP